MSTAFLITGLGGTGKSTLERIFRQDDSSITYDIDDGYAEWRDKQTGRPVEYVPNDSAWNARSTWALRRELLEEKIRESAKRVLVFGMTNDLDQHADLFSKIFILEYPDEQTIRNRLAGRKEGFGKNEPEIQRILRDYLPYQSVMRQLGGIAIDCTLPIEDVVGIIRNHIDVSTLNKE